LTVVVPPSVPPAPEKIETVTGAVELVKVLFNASLKCTTGWVLKLSPEIP
jgi:hypothetical protein